MHIIRSCSMLVLGAVITVPAVEVEAKKLNTADAVPNDVGANEFDVDLHWHGANRAFDDAGASADRGGRARDQGIDIGYVRGVATGLELGVAVGWVAIDDAAAGDPDNGRGLTDAEVSGKWQFASHAIGDVNLSYALLPMVTMPLGRGHDDTSSLPTASTYWTAGLSVATSLSWGAWSAAADAGVVQAFAGDRKGYRGSLTADLAVGYQATAHVQPEVEVNWGRDRVDGDPARSVAVTVGLVSTWDWGNANVGYQRTVAGANTDDLQMVQVSVAVVF